MDTRLPAHLETAGIMRAVQAEGGFATVVAKGERDAGTIMVITCERGQAAQAWERMPHPDGTRRWTSVKMQDSEDPRAFWDWCEKRHRQDPDLWVLELDIAQAERFILSGGAAG
jgi:hypothetical protein